MLLGRRGRRLMMTRLRPLFPHYAAHGLSAAPSVPVPMRIQSGRPCAAELRPGRAAFINACVPRCDLGETAGRCGGPLRDHHRRCAPTSGRVTGRGEAGRRRLVDESRDATSTRFIYPAVADVAAPASARRRRAVSSPL